MNLSRKHLYWIVAIFGICLRSVGAPPGIDAAKSFLIHANIMSTSRVGYSATLSDKGWAINYILSKSMNPRKDFDEIYRTADSVYGRLYATVGLLERSETNGETEDKLLRALRQQNIKILVQQNDIVDWIHIGDVVDQLYSQETRKRLFVVEGELKSEEFTKTDGESFRDMEKLIEIEVREIRKRKQAETNSEENTKQADARAAEKGSDGNGA